MEVEGDAINSLPPFDVSIANYVSNYDSPTTHTNLTELNDTSSAPAMNYAPANVYACTELQQIYYTTENDASELHNLLSSWNMSSLFDFFVRK